MTSMNPMSAASMRRAEVERRFQEEKPLMHLLYQLRMRAGAICHIVEASSRSWQSALFQGRSHSIGLHFEGPDYLARAEAFMTDLDSAEWTIPGHFVADIQIEDGNVGPDSVWLKMSALTIEDW